MKSIFKIGFLVMAQFFFQAATASADLTTLNRSAIELNGAAVKKIEFLISRMKNCTKYHKRINDRLIPKKNELKAYQAKISLACAAALNSSDNLECGAISRNSAKDINKASQAALLELDKMVDFMDAKYADMLRALEADSKYPNCIATISGDKNSTIESITFREFQKVLKKYRDVVSKMHSESLIAMNDSTNKVCSLNKSASVIDSPQSYTKIKPLQNVKYIIEKKPKDLGLKSAL